MNLRWMSDPNDSRNAWVGKAMGTLVAGFGFVALALSVTLFWNSKELAKTIPFGIRDSSSRSSRTGYSGAIPEYRENRRNAHGVALILGTIGYTIVLFGVPQFTPPGRLTRTGATLACALTVALLTALHLSFEIFLPLAIPPWMLAVVLAIWALIPDGPHKRDGSNRAC